MVSRAAILGAKAEPTQRQNFGKGGKGGKAAAKFPGKKAGMSGDTPKARKALVAKKGK